MTSSSSTPSSQPADAPEPLVDGKPMGGAGGQGTNRDWNTPSIDNIPQISRRHAAAMEQADNDDVWCIAGMYHVVLYTRGRRSGNPHKVALPFWLDEHGERIVVASFGGYEHHPGWYHNLADREANPQVRCLVKEGEYWSTPEILDGDEYEQTWAALTADRAWYQDYQDKTERRIPLVRLPETGRQTS